MRQEIVSYVNSLEETRNMLLAPFGQLVPPLPLKSLDRVLLPVRLLHVSLLQHPTGEKVGGPNYNGINGKSDAGTSRSAHRWSGRRRLSVGGSRGLRRALSSFSSRAKVEKP